jgi:hypothetical protein
MMDAAVEWASVDLPYRSPKRGFTGFRSLKILHCRVISVGIEHRRASSGIMRFEYVTINNQSGLPFSLYVYMHNY